jgi:hypothetical protein
MQIPIKFICYLVAVACAVLGEIAHAESSSLTFYIPQGTFAHGWGAIKSKDDLLALLNKDVDFVLLRSMNCSSISKTAENVSDAPLDLTGKNDGIQISGDFQVSAECPKTYRLVGTISDWGKIMWSPVKIQISVYEGTGIQPVRTFAFENDRLVSAP